VWLVLQVTSVTWKENELNMVDTPGHADFGGEVRLSAEIAPFNLELHMVTKDMI